MEKCPICDDTSAWCDVCNGAIDIWPPTLVCWECLESFPVNPDQDVPTCPQPDCRAPWDHNIDRPYQLELPYPYNDAVHRKYYPEEEVSHPDHPTKTEYYADRDADF